MQIFHCPCSLFQKLSTSVLPQLIILRSTLQVNSVIEYLKIFVICKACINWQEIDIS